jgi:hypothetical protein
MSTARLLPLFWALAASGALAGDDLDAGLAGHWPLAGDSKDCSGQGLDAVSHGADFTAPGLDGRPGGAAGLDGRGTFLEVPAREALALAKGDFSIALWIHTESQTDDVPGDILSRYDSKRRRGFHLTLKTNAGVTFSQANWRQLQFGIDDGRESPWVDCGRPGNALLAFALAVHDGRLYAGTCEPGKDERGRVWSYAGGTAWTDCGAPAPCNAVTALAAFEGKLFAGTGRYRLAGSALPESENTQPGGRVFRYDGGTTWADCGQLPGAEATGGMAVFRGRLYASSLYKPAGFFRYEGGTSWRDCGTPGGRRCEALAVHDGFLYASSYDAGRVFRYDGAAWTDCGQLGDALVNTQTYSFAVYEQKLHAGTWRSGRVYRLDGASTWTDAGRLGEELEVMGMLVHNGRLLAGTLPLAEVYAYEGGANWRRSGRIDTTPAVQYRRAWTMAEHEGKLFVSTLPSGRIWAFEAGRMAAWDRELPSVWRHVAAIKRARGAIPDSSARLELYVDGALRAESRPFDPGDYDLDCAMPLRIGLGQNASFCGRLAGLRLYRRALSAAEVAQLAKR